MQKTFEVQIEQVSNAVDTLASTLGGLASSIQFTLRPNTLEETADRDEKRFNSYGSKHFSKESAQALASKLEEMGLKKHWDNGFSGDEKYICMSNSELFSDSGVCFFIYYKQSKEDRCAELKRQLADLGCHY